MDIKLNADSQCYNRSAAKRECSVAFRRDRQQTQIDAVPNSRAIKSALLLIYARRHSEPNDAVEKDRYYCNGAAVEFNEHSVCALPINVSSRAPTRANTDRQCAVNKCATSARKYARRK